MTEIFKNNVAEIRKKRNLSQKELSQRLQISIWHLNKIENHKKPLTTTLAMRIAAELDVTLNDIFLK